MAKKSKKVIKSICFAMVTGFVVSGAVFPLTASAAGNDNASMVSTVSNTEEVDLLNVIASGTTEYGCKWSIDKNYGLTITGGKGSVLYGSDNTCWKDYYYMITSINIDVPEAKYMSEMFKGYSEVKTIKAKIGKITGSLHHTFSCSDNRQDVDPRSALVSADLSGMNISGVTNICGLFYNCRNLTNVNVSNWDTSKVEDMDFVFSFCKNLKNVDLSKWNTSSVTNMRAMFQSCNSLEKVDVSNWDTSKVLYMDYLFSGCKNIKKLNVSGWNTSNVVTMNNMFTDCFELPALDVSHFNTSKVTNMSYMFWECKSLKKLDVSHFDTQNVTDVYRMFEYCHGLTSLDLSSFSLEKVVNPEKLTHFIDGCDALTFFRTPKNVKVKAPINTEHEKGRYWYRDDTNTELTKLPKDLKISVPVHLQEKDNKVVDVRTTDWEYNAVKYATDSKLMNGVGTTKDAQQFIIFKGKDTLTRGMFIKVLFNKENPKVTSKMSNPFKDVKTTDYYYDAVRWASNKKIVNGTSAKTFSPNEPITRQDLVVILYNYAKAKGNKYVSITKYYNLSGFVDHNKVSDYAVTPITWATCHNIIKGKPNTAKKYNLDPKGLASRSECAQILLNFDNYLKSVK